MPHLRPRLPWVLGLLSGVFIGLPVGVYHLHKAIATRGICYATMDRLTDDEIFEIGFDHLQSSGVLRQTYDDLDDFAERNHPCCELLGRNALRPVFGNPWGVASPYYLERIGERVEGRTNWRYSTRIDRCGKILNADRPPSFSQIRAEKNMMPYSWATVENCVDDNKPEIGFSIYCPESQR